MKLRESRRDSDHDRLHQGAGRSGLTAEGRPAFTEMMEEWVKKQEVQIEFPFKSV